MTSSRSASSPQTTSNVTNTDKRTGVDGTGNRVVGADGRDNSVNIDGGSGSGFRPTFFFNGGSQPMTLNRVASEYQGNGDPYGEPRDTGYGQPTATAPTAASPGNFGGAADNGASVIGGGVTGFVNTGNNDAPVITGSVAGPFSFGNNSPVISGPIGAPVVNGDAVFRGNVITGNNGPVTINTADASVATAAISSAGRSLDAGLGFAEKALGIVADSKQDPNARVADSTLKTILFAALGLGALYAFSK